MAADQEQTGFYRELDRYRHSTGFGCVVAFFLMGLLLLAALWYVVSILYFKN